MLRKAIVVLVLAMVAVTGWGETERVDLGDFYVKANAFADREDPDYLLTDLRMTEQIDVTKGAQLEGKLLQTYFPIGSTLIQLQALNKPQRAPYVFFLLFTKDQFKQYLKDNYDITFNPRYVGISGVKYQNYSVKTIIPGVSNNFWVFVPTARFKTWDADKFGEVEYQEPDSGSAATADVPADQGVRQP